MATKVNGMIQKVNLGNTVNYAIASTAYGYCQTAAGTAAKVVDMTGFTLLEGTTIHVKFQYNNTASSPTLNVNGTGAKNIVQYDTTAVGNVDSTSGWYAGAVVQFTYDGTSWVRDQGFNYYSNTDTKVTSTTAITTNNAYPIILAYSTTSSGETNTVNKTTTLTYNPSTKALSVSGGSVQATTFTGNLDGTAKYGTDNTKLPLAGGTMTGAVKIKGILGTSGTDYGDTLPASGTEGQLFFQTSGEYYELPAGGTAGYALVKSSSADRDVMWAPMAAGGPTLNTTVNAIAKFADTSGTLVNSVVTITSAGTIETPANIWAGNASQTGERTVRAESAAGKILLFSKGSTTGARGIYAYNNAGTGTNVITIDQDNVITLNGRATQDGSGNTITSTYVKKAGDTMTGNLLGNKTNNIGSTTIGQHFHQLYLGGATTGSNALNSANPLIEFADSDRSQYGQLIYTDFDSVRSPDGLTWVGNQANSWFQAPRVFGAVWNDYAEYRETKDDIQPGRCVVETGKGDLILSTERLQGGCEIVSDTFGFAIGETKTCKTPTACAGRVLAYLYEDNSMAKPGDPVCSGPNGTVSLMSHEEEREWPSRIIGTISEIPDYEEWEYGSADEFGNKNKLKVDGRVWIRVR